MAKTKVVLEYKKMYEKVRYKGDIFYNALFKIKCI